MTSLAQFEQVAADEGSHSTRRGNPCIAVLAAGGAPLSRHVTVYTVEANATGDNANIVTALQVFKTDLDGGSTALLAVGKIYDQARRVDGSARSLNRQVWLETRNLGIGTHIPL